MPRRNFVVVMCLVLYHPDFDLSVPPYCRVVARTRTHWSTTAGRLVIHVHPLWFSTECAGSTRISGVDSCFPSSSHHCQVIGGRRFAAVMEAGAQVAVQVWIWFTARCEYCTAVARSIAPVLGWGTAVLPARPHVCIRTSNIYYALEVSAACICWWRRWWRRRWDSAECSFFGIGALCNCITQSVSSTVRSIHSSCLSVAQTAVFIAHVSQGRCAFQCTFHTSRSSFREQIRSASSGLCCRSTDHRKSPPGTGSSVHYPTASNRSTCHRLVRTHRQDRGEDRRC
eukprot:SAG31_NODE_3985_length_3685_cov_2.692694_3_plen_284_part_00